MSRLLSARACERDAGREGGPVGELLGDEATLPSAEGHPGEGEGGARAAGSAVAAVSAAAAAMATADMTVCTLRDRMGSRALLGRTTFAATCAATNRLSIGGVLLPLW